jgi:hypothetical protein
MITSWHQPSVLKPQSRKSGATDSLSHLSWLFPYFVFQIFRFSGYRRVLESTWFMPMEKNRRPWGSMNHQRPFTSDIVKKLLRVISSGGHTSAS